MCVIAYFEKDRELNKQELINCFNENPDGAGIMYFDKKKSRVHIQKGFMTFDEFWDVASKLPTYLDRVFHFRIATSGKVSGACCHPFPITHDYKLMSRTDVWCKKGMVHNGVMSDYTPALGMKASHSDTMQFIREVVHPLGEAIHNTAVHELWEKAMGTNKYIVLSQKGVDVIGNFVQSKESGALYSNSSYTGSRWGYSKPVGQINWWDSGYCDYGYDDVYEDYATVNTVDNITEFCIEIWTGRMDDKALIEFEGDVLDFLEGEGIYPFDVKTKPWSIVLYFESAYELEFLPTDGKLCGKNFTIGEKDYQVAKK